MQNKDKEGCKECGKTTKFMYPVADSFFCEEHGKGLCCSNCFELYALSFPERAHSKWSGHCGGGGCECHKIVVPILNKDKEGWEKRFDKWADETTATFGTADAGDGYSEDYNISFKELAFYDDLKKEIRKTIKKEKEIYSQDLIEKIEGKKVRHVIDSELYHDTGGGEMCENCGKQGYIDTKEICEPNEINEALSTIQEIIKET